MTLDEMKQSKEVFILADDIAEILGSDPQTIRSTAKEDQSKLGFPVVIVGNRVKIPRKPFLKWMCEI